MIRDLITLSTFTLLAGFAGAAPLSLLDRNGSYVAIESYAPNIVRVTLSVDKDLALADPGYGIIGAVDLKGWTHTTNASGDVFSSAAMSLEVAAQPWPHAPSQMERYFAPSLPPISLKRAQTRRRYHPGNERLGHGAPHRQRRKDLSRRRQLLAAPCR